MPSNLAGTLGSRLYMSGAIASTIDTEGEFAALTWTEIGLIENFGEFGRVFDLVTFQAVKDGRTYKLKGGFNDGSIQLTVAQDLSDDGQEALYDAATAADQNNYGFRIDLNDAPSGSGGGSRFYFRGLPMSFRTQMGSVNSVVRAMATIEVNSDVLYAPSADYLAAFANGFSLAGYALFNGSDAEAVDPVVTGNALVLVSGDATAGTDAANGSQAILNTPWQIDDGTLLVLEADVKISAITNVRMFFGWTDQNAALEDPIESAASADTITTNATDAVGFMFDTAMATDNIWLVGVNNNVDETAQNSALAFVADTFRKLRIELNASGDATFRINGTAIGTVMTSALRVTVNLYPTVFISSLSTATRTMTVDNLYVRQD